MKDREPKRLRGLSGIATSLLLAACAPSAPAPTQYENQTPAPTPRATEVLGTNIDNSILEMGWPINRSVENRFTSGPHNSNYNNRTDMTVAPYNQYSRNRLDFAGMEPVSCVQNPNASMEFDVIASRSGEVMSIGGDYGIIMIKDNQGFFESYTHVDGEQIEVGERVQQGDVIAEELICPKNDNDTKEVGLHLDYSVTDATGDGVNMTRIVFVDSNGGRTTNTESPINYNGALILPDGQFIIADAGVTEHNIIPALGGTAVETSTPTPQITEILQEPQTENPLLGAKQKILQLWANTWERSYSKIFNMDNIEETDPKNFDHAIFIETHAPGYEEWYTAEKDNLLNGIPTSTPLTITMNFAAEYIWQQNKAAAGRYIGEMEINNLVLKSSEIFPVTPADIANDITWQGAADANYIARYRALSYNDNTLDANNFARRGIVEDWLARVRTDALPPFGDWKNESQSVELSAINGRWVLKSFFPRDVYSPWDVERAFDYSDMIPDGFLDLNVPILNFGFGSSQPTCLRYDSDCKRIEIDYTQ